MYGMIMLSEYKKLESDNLKLKAKIDKLEKKQDKAFDKGYDKGRNEGYSIGYSDGSGKFNW